MIVAIDIDDPLSAVIRKFENFKKTSQRNKMKCFGTRRRQNGGLQKTEVLNKLSNDSREVRIKLSNLAPTVLSDELGQLFEEFQIRNVSLNFNEKGKSVGTADITLSKRHADLLVKKFSGISLDGMEMKFAMIDAANIAHRVIFPETPRRSSNGNTKTVKKIMRRSQPSRQKKVPRKPKRLNKPKMTIEELDAELDAYMAHSI